MFKILLCLILGKGVNDMAVVYATLIVKGKKNYADVPAKLKEQVKEILIDLDCADLVTE
jgi:hypothetical protein|nr:MAG TPA: hypothetical protein [Caudoviricetes sp.]